MVLAESAGLVVEGSTACVAGSGDIFVRAGFGSRSCAQFVSAHAAKANNIKRRIGYPGIGGRLYAGGAHSQICRRGDPQARLEGKRGLAKIKSVNLETVVVAQLVEHKVVVLGVAGSSPVDHPFF